MQTSGTGKATDEMSDELVTMVASRERRPGPGLLCKISGYSAIPGEGACVCVETRLGNHRHHQALQRTMVLALRETVPAGKVGCQT